MFEFLRNTPIDDAVVAANHVIRALEYRRDSSASFDAAFAAQLSNEEQAVASSIIKEISQVEGLPLSYLTAEVADGYTAVLAETIQNNVQLHLTRDAIRGGRDFLSRWQQEEEEIKLAGGRDNSGRLMFLLAGAGLGAALALLFAPKSGAQLRDEIAEATREGVRRSRAAAQHLESSAGDLYDTVRETAGEYYEATRARSAELHDVAARNTAAGRAGSLAAAVEAGKRAYVEEKRKAELSGHSEAASSYKPERAM